jgi:hypothetical protein
MSSKKSPRDRATLDVKALTVRVEPLLSRNRKYKAENRLAKMATSIRMTTILTIWSRFDGLAKEQFTGREAAIH